MKKIILSLFLVFALSSSVFAESFDIPKKFIKIGIIEVSFMESADICYDEVSKVVYYVPCHRYFSITPYYSSNGKLCKYDEVNKKLVEIEDK